MRNAHVTPRLLCAALGGTLLAAGCAGEVPDDTRAGSQSIGSGAIESLAGCTANTLARNDDGSTGRLGLGFTLNFFGVTYSSLWVNNNGNVTFDAPMSTYTPFNLYTTGRPLIAPFFGDVDTRGAGSDVVQYGPTTFNGHPTFCVNWAGVGVGYYSLRVDKLNKFQLLLVNRADTGNAENFDIVFNYDQIQWEAGQASGGTNGLGGSPARAGYSNGVAANSYELPGSGVVGALLDANHTSGLIYNHTPNTPVPGRYVFEVRNGRVPVCGDGFVDSGEQCDDHNTASGDGCSALCQIEVNRPPTAICQSVTVTAPTGACGAAVSVDDGSSDPDVGDSVTATQSPAGPYAVGTTMVTLTVTDSHGASSSCEAAVTVLDAERPVIACPTIAPAECTGAAASYALPSATAMDNCGAVTLGAPPSGPYDLGAHTLVYTATDGSSNASSCMTEFTVVDTTAPTVTLSGASAITLECGGAAFVDPGATAADVCRGDLTASVVASGSVNVGAVGTYTLRYDVTDGSNAASATRTVTVADTLPPVITPRAGAITLWPPSHDLRALSLADCATAVVDQCGGALDVNAAGRVTSITSDEPEDARGGGDGATRGDMVISGGSAFQLRAEREGSGNGRVYTVRYRVTDARGNSVDGACRVAVPHDDSGRAAADDGAAAGYTIP